MIDVHNHILHDIDDGARGLEESVELVKEAKKAGFDKIISTSHYMEGYYEADSNERKELIDELKEELKKQSVDIKIYLGNEIYLSSNIIKLLEEEKASTLNGTDYVLFEMPLNIKPLNLYEIIYKIQSNKKIPILAHPERYTFVQEDIQLIYDLIEKGVLMQANFASIVGVYGKNAQKTVKHLFKNDMVHLLGSDTHRKGTIYKEMPRILNVLKEFIGEDRLTELTQTNPERVLDNEKIFIRKPQKRKQTIFERIIKRK